MSIFDGTYCGSPWVTLMAALKHWPTTLRASLLSMLFPLQLPWVTNIFNRCLPAAHGREPPLVIRQPSSFPGATSFITLNSYFATKIDKHFELLENRRWGNGTIILNPAPCWNIQQNTGWWGKGEELGVRSQTVQIQTPVPLLKLQSPWEITHC